LLSGRTLEVPDKKKAILAARELLLWSDIRWLPVDPKKLYKTFNWTLLTYNEAQFVLGKEKIDRLRKNKIEASTMAHPLKPGVYVTIYDETIYQQRVRFTLAHEIGHIVLDHFSSNKGWRVFESEAHYFAAELLAPLPILEELPIRNEYDIMNICGLSYEAAKNRLTDLQLWKRLSDEISNQLLPNEDLVELFKDFLEPVAKCEFNGQIKAPGVVLMSQKHHFVQIDENGRFSLCPRCGNNDISDEATYCKMCGFYLFNKCINDSAYNDSIVNFDYRQYCGAINDGDARYCEHCGSPTILTRAGLVTTWEEWRQYKEEVAATKEDPFSNASNAKDPFSDDDESDGIELSDDDLPF